MSKRPASMQPPRTPMQPSSNVNKSSHYTVSKQIHSNKEENNVNDASFIHLMANSNSAVIIIIIVVIIQCEFSVDPV